MPRHAVEATRMPRRSAASDGGIATVGADDLGVEAGARLTAPAQAAGAALDPASDDESRDWEALRNELLAIERKRGADPEICTDGEAEAVADLADRLEKAVKRFTGASIWDFCDASIWVFGDTCTLHKARSENTRHAKLCTLAAIAHARVAKLARASRNGSSMSCRQSTVDQTYLKNLKSHKKALSYAAAALHCDPDNTAALYEAALEHAAKGEYHSSQQCLKRCRS
jgi:hypothetical protein